MNQVPFEKADMDWLKGVLDGQLDNMLSHGRTERIVIHIEHLEGDREFFQGRDSDQCREISRNHQKIAKLEARIKLLEEYADHKPECVRATIHRAFFSDKNPCDCGFDAQIGLELKHIPHGERVKNNPFKN